MVRIKHNFFYRNFSYYVRKTVIVDGLNVLSKIRINKNIKNNVLSKYPHHYKNFFEINQDVKFLYYYFNNTFGKDINIYIILKKYNNHQLFLWEHLIKQLYRVFEQKSLKIYCAIPQNIKDRECDDRIIIRICLKLQYNGITPYVLSQDKFRNINKHWDLNSEYIDMKSGQRVKILDSYKYSKVDIANLVNLQYLR